MAGYCSITNALKTSPSINGKLTISQSKSSRLSKILVETILLGMDICKYKLEIVFIKYCAPNYMFVHNNNLARLSTHRPRIGSPNLRLLAVMVFQIYFCFNFMLICQGNKP